MCRRQSVNPALVSYYTSKTQVVSTTRDVNRDARQKYGHIAVTPGCSRNNFIYSHSAYQVETAIKFTND